MPVTTSRVTILVVVAARKFALDHISWNGKVQRRRREQKRKKERKIKVTRPRRSKLEWDTPGSRRSIHGYFITLPRFKTNIFDSSGLPADTEP